MRIRGKIFWLILCFAWLVPILLSGTALAQEEKTDISLRLIPGDYNKKVIPGEETILHLEVHNDGDKPVTNIKFSSETPEGWDIEFDPAVIDYLGTGTFQTVDINVRASKSAGRGEHQVTIVAEANETRRITTAFLRVESGTTIWTWIGITVAALVIAGFIIVYKRFGRQ
jgi:uncharacterized membrane protein